MIDESGDPGAGSAGPSATAQRTEANPDSRSETRHSGEERELLSMALEVRKRAYAVYSRFPVGAALRGRSGRVYTGCNVENASYPLTICAERAAVAKAVSEGEREFDSIAVVSATGAMPCGACRQVLYEFSVPEGELKVIVGDGSENARIYTIGELLPAGFQPDQLG